MGSQLIHIWNQINLANSMIYIITVKYKYFSLFHCTNQYFTFTALGHYTKNTPEKNYML